MKPITQNLIAAFVSGLTVAVLVFFLGRPWISDERVRNEEPQTEDYDVREKMLAYFDENDIPYDKSDTVDIYGIRYQDENYLIRISPEEEFIRIVGFGESVNGTDYHVLLETANDTEIEKGGANVLIVGKKEVIFTIVHMVDVHTDISELLPRLLRSININRETFYEKLSEQ